MDREKFVISARRLSNFYADQDSIILTGSAGDPYGTVTPESDLDIHVFCREESPLTIYPDGFEVRRSKITDKHINPDGGIVRDEMTYRGIPVSVDFRLDSPIKRQLEKLEQIRAYDIILDRRNLHYLMKYFLDTTILKDETGKIEKIKERLVRVFGLVRSELGSIYKKKFEENVEDITIYIPERLRDKKDLRIIQGLYAICCYRNLPRSISYIGYRRNRKLLEALGVSIETSKEELLSMMS